MVDIQPAPFGVTKVNKKYLIIQSHIDGRNHKNISGKGNFFFFSQGWVYPFSLVAGFLQIKPFKLNYTHYNG